MGMKFRVTYDDGRVVEVTAKPKDLVAFERQYSASVASFADAGKPPQLEWLYYLAWSPLHRTRQDPRAFDEFLDDVEEIEAIEEPDAEAAPTPRTPSPAPWPGSPSEPASPLGT